MKKLLVVLLGLAVLANAAAAAQPGHRIEANNRKIPDPKWLREELERVRAKYKLPALAASLVIGDKVVAASAVGHRKVGNPTKVTQHDRFCVGSVTKAMTATLVGVMVDKGVLTLDTTMEQMFPELVGKMQPSYRKVTVRQLLDHTSGMPGSPKKFEVRKRTPDDLKLTMARRYEYVCNAVVDPPLSKPGKEQHYGGGCVIVVSYLERKFHKPYEGLMNQYVFRPLGMTTAGKFEMVSGPDKLDSPWPHQFKDGHFEPVPLLIGRGFSRAPAGGVCCSIGDLGKWAAAELLGAKGQSTLLRGRTFRELQQKDPKDHASTSFTHGRPGWAGAEVLGIGGAHVGLSAGVWIVPEHNFAICLASNSPGPVSGKAQKEVRKFLAERAMEMQHKGKPKRGGQKR